MLGQLAGTFCSDCSDEKEYILGIGFLFSDIMNVLDQIPKGAQKKIHEIFSLYTVKYSEFSYKLFECKCCDTAHTRLHVFVQYDKGRSYSPTYRCSDCRRKLVRSKRKLSTFKCRKCGSYGLQKRRHDLLWD